MTQTTGLGRENMQLQYAGHAEKEPPQLLIAEKQQGMSALEYDIVHCYNSGTYGKRKAYKLYPL